MKNTLLSKCRRILNEWAEGGSYQKNMHTINDPEYFKIRRKMMYQNSIKLILSAFAVFICLGPVGIVVSTLVNDIKNLGLLLLLWPMFLFAGIPALGLFFFASWSDEKVKRYRAQMKVFEERASVTGDQKTN